MKNKYERMNKEEKKELYNNYKQEKFIIFSKMKKMFVLCYLGIAYGLLVFIYDYFIKKSTLGYILDLVVLIFSILSLLKVNSIKKDLLNKYAIEKDNKRKQEVVKKYKK